MKILQINSTYNWGSTGRIADGIGTLVTKNNWKSYVVFGRYKNDGNSITIKIGNRLYVYIHFILSRLFDIHGLGSYFSTIFLIKKIKKINPDIIHLHNIHGYYLNYCVLFDYLKKSKTPIVWTLHDCWPFTGHCAYYSFIGCSKWKEVCSKCPQINAYPKSYIERTKTNFLLKKKMFQGLDNITLVPVSNWLAGEVKQSFLKEYKVRVIHNGVDIDVFYPKDIKSNDVIILGVASIWEKRKGLDDFYRLRKLLPKDYRILLIGLDSNQIKKLPSGISGITRTNNVEELVKIYSSSTLLFNPTYEDNFPTVNLEALACGIPVITYDTGGSPEAIDNTTGFVIKQRDMDCAVMAINTIVNNGKDYYRGKCRERAMKFFNKESRYEEYIDLYKVIRKKDYSLK